jgi:Ion channel
MDPGARPEKREGGWSRRAQVVEDAYGLVLILVLLTYVLASVLENRGWSAVLLAVATSATSIVALTSSRSRPSVVRRAIVVAASALVLSAAAAIFGGRYLFGAAWLLQILLLAAAMAAVLRHVLTERTVSTRTILGAISVYTSLGLLFTWAYGTIDRLEGGGFFGEGVATKGSDLLFFSYTTLTTTGYGDLVPAGQLGRMVSGLEMMLGQIFLVTLVAGLVSLWTPGQALLRRRRGREDGDAAEGRGPA